MKNEVRTGHLSHAPMTRKDWGYLAIFLVVASIAGLWVGAELRKPFGIVWEGVLVHQESPIEIIVLKNGQKLVRNKREGFEVRIPGEWEIEASGRAFYSPATVTEGRGCKIENGNARNTQNLSARELVAIPKEIDPFVSIVTNQRAVKIVRGLEAVHTVIETLETGYSEEIEIPYGEKIYWFALFAAASDKRECSETFNNLINSFVIK